MPRSPGRSLALLRASAARAGVAFGAVVCACVAGTGLATPAVAADTDPTGYTVGGSRLAATGVVVDPRPGVPALPGDLTAASWLVADADTGEVLAARGAHTRRLPAST